VQGCHERSIAKPERIVMTGRVRRRAAEVEMIGLDGSVGFLLKRAQLAVSRDIHRVFEHDDITAVQFSALLVIRNNPGIGQGDLAGALEVERPRMVPVLDTLERRGLAARRRDPRDARSRRIHLTSAGEAMLDELQHRFSALEQELAEALGADQRDQLVEMLRVLAERPR
jgi:DNA-binding MarR family transcriptional regulator